MRGQILGENSILILTASLSKIMRVSTGSDISSASSIEQSVVISGCGRGHGRDFEGQERGSVRGCGSYGGRQSASEISPRQCKHCMRGNHISKKYWEKFDRSEWAHLSDSDLPAPCGNLRSLHLLFLAFPRRSMINSAS